MARSKSKHLRMISTRRQKWKRIEKKKKVAKKAAIKK